MNGSGTFGYFGTISAPRFQTTVLFPPRPPMLAKRHELMRRLGTVLRQSIRMMTVMDKDAEQRLEEIFYQSIGSAISSWAAMESSIVAIASVLLETSFQKAGLVFYSMNFHAWLSVVDELFLLDEKYSDKRSEWISICKRLRELNDIRVRLAHHTSLERDRASTLPSLRPPRFDMRLKSQKHAPLDTGQIVRFIADVWLVQKRLSDLFEEIVVTIASAHRSPR